MNQHFYNKFENNTIFNYNHSHFHPNTPRNTSTITTKLLRDTEQMEVPGRIFELPEIQRAVKKKICEYAEYHPGEAERRYNIPKEVISLWVKEISSDKILEGLIGKRSEIPPNNKNINNNIIENTRNTGNTPLNPLPMYQRYPTTTTSRRIVTPYSRAPQHRTYHARRQNELKDILGVEEIQRIVYDFQTFNVAMSIRKWGIYRRTFLLWAQAIHITPRSTRNPQDVDESTLLWEERVLLNINTREEKLLELGVGNVEHSVRNSLLLRGERGLDIQGLCKLGLEKGIAVVAAKYGVNLFHFEFLLMHIFTQEYDQMEKNNWFIGDVGYLEDTRELSKWQRTESGDSALELSPDKQMQIIRCMNDHGALFAHKKYHISFNRIYSINSMYKKFGMSVLSLTPKHKTVSEYIYIYI